MREYDIKMLIRKVMNENNGYEIFAGLCDGFYKNSSQQFNTYGEYEIVTIKKDLLK